MKVVAKAKSIKEIAKKLNLKPTKQKVLKCVIQE